MVSILPHVSSSSRLFSKQSFDTLPRTPITTVITVTLMFYGFFSSPANSLYLFIVSLYLIITLWSTGRAKSTIWQVLSCLLINTKSGLQAGISWSVFISKPWRILCISTLLNGYVLIPFGCMVKFESLAQFPVDYLSYTVVPSLMLLSYQFATNFYYAIIPFYLYLHIILLFCCVLSVFALM